MKNNLISISEFAKLTNTTRDTLIFYDKIGLFKPIKLSESKYRLYSILQYDMFYMINNLKELGIPLKKIKEYVDERSVDSLDDLLNYSINAIKKQKEHLTNCLVMIEELKKNNLEVSNVNDLFVFSELENNYLYLGKKIQKFDVASLNISLASLVKEARRKNLNTNSTLGLIKDTNSLIQNEDYDSYENAYLVTRKKYEGTIKRTFGKYLIYYHFGNYESISKGYELFRNYLIENKIKTDSPIYEEVIQNDLTTDDEEKYLTKIFVKVV